MFSSLTCLLIAAVCVHAAGANIDPRSREADRLIQQGRFIEAAGMLREVYDDARKSGTDDGRLSSAAADLGGAYIFLDRYAEAEELLNEAMRIDRCLFGAEAPETARHDVIRAKAYISLGKVREGEALLLHARPILERAYGPESPKIGAILNHLGLVNDLLDRQPQAAALYRQAIAVYEKQATPAQRSLMTIVMSNLISVLVDLGQYDEAVALAEKTVAMVERTFGSGHPYLARTLHNLGTVYQAQRRTEEAKSIYLRALSIWEKNPGIGRLDATTAESSLAAIYADQGYYSRAEQLLKNALATRESILGPHAVELASTLNNLGVLYAHENRLTEARKTLERGLAIAEGTIGATHTRTIPLIANLGWVYFNEGRSNKDRYLRAEEMYRRVLAVQERRLGPDRIEVSDVLVNLAEVCLAKKNYRAARQLEERALAIRRAVLGPQHPDTVKTLKQYTFLLHKSRE